MSTSNKMAVAVAAARQATGRPASQRGLAVWLLACVAFVAACSVSPTAPSAPTRWVTDSAGFLSPAMRDVLDQRLQAYQVSSGHELLVWIAPTVANTTIEEFAVRAFAAWKVGRKGLDDGLVLFIFATDRKLRIEVGYGLEGIITDAQAARIINDVMGPPLRAVQPDAAVDAGVTALMTLIAPEATATTNDSKNLVGSASPGRNVATKPVPPLSIWWIIFGSLGGLAFIALALTHPRMAMLLVANVFARGFGGGGGGRIGGGGRSGGGGASGGW